MRSRTPELLRRAVVASDYREVERLLDVYQGEVESCWRQADSDDERRALSTDVTALLGWARQSILAARSQTQSKLIQLTQRSAYVKQLELDA
jgi:hypothetical protein